MLGMAHSKSWFDLQPMHKHTLYQYRQMTFLSGEQMPKCIFITHGIISLSVVSVRLQIIFTSVFEAVWVAIQSRKYETWGKGGSQTRQDLIFRVLCHLQKDPRVFRMSTAPGLPAGDAHNLEKEEERRSNLVSIHKATTRVTVARPHTWSHLVLVL